MFGFDRGLPVDRYYIEGFLRRHQGDVRGAVMEVGDPGYTRRFGGSAVVRSDVLHVREGTPGATVVGDLATGEGVPRDTYDCLILTQTFQFVYDVRAAIDTCHGALKEGGVLLGTFPGISQISRYDMDRWGEYWRFTSASAHRLFADRFSAENVSVEAHGNVLAAVALLHGLAAHELDPAELEHRDADYEVLIAVRAVRRGAGR